MDKGQMYRTQSTAQENRGPTRRMEKNLPEKSNLSTSPTSGKESWTVISLRLTLTQATTRTAHKNGEQRDTLHDRRPPFGRYTGYQLSTWDEKNTRSIEMNTTATTSSTRLIIYKTSIPCRKKTSRLSPYITSMPGFLRSRCCASFPSTAPSIEFLRLAAPVDCLSLRYVHKFRRCDSVRQISSVLRIKLIATT